MFLAASMAIACAATSSAEDAATKAPVAGDQADAAATTSQETKYTGAPISISLNDVELSEVFRVIHEASGQDIVVDPSLQGRRITLKLDDAPWDQVLAVVLKTQGFDQVRDGNSIRIVDAHPAARATLVKARLAADVGDHAEALALLGPLADRDTVWMDVRCEAMVRKGALLMQDGNRREANMLYAKANDICHDQLEAMRLLAEAVTGVQQDPATWRGRTEPFVLEFASTSAVDLPEPRLEYLADIPARPIDNLPGDGDEWQPMSFTGEPISVSMKDADLADVFRLFSTMSGMRIDLAPEALKIAKPVSLSLADVPWDQAFSLVLQTNRLRAMKVDGGFRVEPLPDAGVTSSP
jgi:type II secretory pathway component GspD/PulD (secretin)